MNDLRKCSMCGEYKETTRFRFMIQQNRHNAYCKDCERWYQRHYKRKLTRENFMKEELV